MGACSSKDVKENPIVLPITQNEKKQAFTPSTPDFNKNFDICKTETVHLQPYVHCFFEAKGAFPGVYEEPFTEKIILFEGQNAREMCSGEIIGITCRKGLKEGVNQDNFVVVSKPPYMFAAVFDGHGVNGHFVSDLAGKILPEVLLADIEMSLDPVFSIRDCFRKTQEIIKKKCAELEVDCSLSGCTATAILLAHKKMYVSHLGDSRAILTKRYQDKLVPVPLTNDHKASDPIEKSRILRHGGHVEKTSGTELERVFLPVGCPQGLTITRAFGDTAFTQVGVISEPFIKECKIRNGDEFVVICSDGVWEFMSNYEVSSAIEKNKQNASNDIAKFAWDRWIENTDDVVDDITVVIIPL